MGYTPIDDYVSDDEFKRLFLNYIIDIADSLNAICNRMNEY